MKEKIFFFLLHVSAKILRTIKERRFAHEIHVFAFQTQTINADWQSIDTAGMSESEDLSLPRATVQKILTEILPNDTIFSKEAKEALIECCINFIMIVATESNDIAEQDLKKTISTDHVIRSMENLGFDHYIPILNEFVESCRNNAKIKEKRKESKFVKSGLTEEELLAKQQELFRASRDRLNR